MVGRDSSPASADSAVAVGTVAGRMAMKVPADFVAAVVVVERIAEYVVANIADVVAVAAADAERIAGAVAESTAGFVAQAAAVDMATVGDVADIVEPVVLVVARSCADMD